MPARNRTSVADVPIFALLSMISDPKKFGALIQQFSESETKAKVAESAATDRLNAAGDAENVIKAREQVVASNLTERQTVDAERKSGGEGADGAAPALAPW